MNHIFAATANFLRPYLTKAGRTAASNLFILGVYTLLAQLCALVSVLVLSSTFGRNGFGILSVGLAVQPIMMTIGTLGIRIVVVREGSRDASESRLDILASSHFLLTTIGGIAIGALVVALAVVLPLTHNERVLLCLIAVGNIGQCLSVASFFDAHHRQTTSALIHMAWEGAGLAAILLLVYGGKATIPIVGSFIAGKWILATATGISVYHWGIHRLRFIFSRENVCLLIQSGWPLMVGGLLVLIPSNTGVLFVRTYHGQGDAGIFGLAQQVAFGYLMLAALALRILRPHIAGPFGMQKSFIRKLVAFVALYLSSLYAAVLAGAIFVITVFLPPTYSSAILPMSILLSGAMAFAASRFATNYLVVLHREHGVLWTNAITALIFAIVSAIAVREYSYVGISWAVVVAYCVGALISIPWAWFGWRAQLSNQHN